MILILIVTFCSGIVNIVLITDIFLFLKWTRGQHLWRKINFVLITFLYLKFICPQNWRTLHYFVSWQFHLETKLEVFFLISENTSTFIFPIILVSWFNGFEKRTGGSEVRPYWSRILEVPDSSPNSNLPTLNLDWFFKWVERAKKVLNRIPGLGLSTKKQGNICFWLYL